jgi:hypothetical protein
MIPFTLPRGCTILIEFCARWCWYEGHLFSSSPFLCLHVVLKIFICSTWNLYPSFFTFRFLNISLFAYDKACNSRYNSINSRQNSLLPQNAAIFSLRATLTYVVQPHHPQCKRVAQQPCCTKNIRTVLILCNRLCKLSISTVHGQPVSQHSDEQHDWSWMGPLMQTPIPWFSYLCFTCICILYYSILNSSNLHGKWMLESNVILIQAERCIFLFIYWIKVVFCGNQNIINQYVTHLTLTQWYFTAIRVANVTRIGECPVTVKVAIVGEWGLKLNYALCSV